MSDTIRLSSEPRATPEDLARVTDAIDTSNMETTGVREFHQIAIFLRDEQEAIRGGITGGVWGGWLHIVGLWIEPEIRGRNLGRELVEAAEAEGGPWVRAMPSSRRTRSRRPGLYRKLGYVPFGELEDYPPGASQIFMRKDL